MKKFLFVLSLIAFSVSGYSQDKSSIREKIKGTYQVQIRGDLRQPVNIPENVFEIIDQKRDANKTTYHYIQNNVRIKIPSKAEILSPKFKPLPEQTIIKEFN